MYEGSILKNIGSGSVNMDEAKRKRVAISITEDDLTEDSLIENIASLAEYPRVTHRQYVINRTEQQNAIWSDFLGSRGRISLRPETREASTEAVLFWLASLLQFTALVLSYSKETMFGGSIFRTTILEILFGAAGILAACYKQWRAWLNSIKSNETKELRELDEATRRNRQNKSIHMTGFIISSNLAGCAMMCCGFALLFLFDREGYSFLKSTMYFTGLTIFTLMIVDNVVMNKLAEGKSIVEHDQVKLLLHEMKEELFEELQLNNKYERVKTLRDYIQKFEAFKLQPKGYIYPV